MCVGLSTTVRPKLDLHLPGSLMAHHRTAYQNLMPSSSTRVSSWRDWFLLHRRSWLERYPSLCFEIVYPGTCTGGTCIGNLFHQNILWIIGDISVVKSDSVVKRCYIACLFHVFRYFQRVQQKLIGLLCCCPNAHQRFVQLFIDYCTRTRTVDTYIHSCRYR